MGPRGAAKGTANESSQRVVVVELSFAVPFTAPAAGCASRASPGLPASDIKRSFSVAAFFVVSCSIAFRDLVSSS
jgi:hypothetical protein